MNINKGQTKDLVFTLDENTTITGPTYLLRLEFSQGTEDVYCFLATELNTNTTRSNRFSVTETDSPNPQLGEVSLKEGQYNYYVYEMTEGQAGVIDFDNITVSDYNIVEGPGMFRVNDSTNNLNTEYISDSTNTVYTP